MKTTKTMPIGEGYYWAMNGDTNEWEVVELTVSPSSALMDPRSKPDMIVSGICIGCTNLDNESNIYDYDFPWLEWSERIKSPEEI